MSIQDEDLQPFKENRKEIEEVVLELNELQLQDIILSDLISTYKSRFISLLRQEEEIVINLQEKFGESVLQELNERENS
jgi:hypothetical protein